MPRSAQDRFVRPADLPAPTSAGGLLADLGVAAESLEVQRQAVDAWLEVHAPSPQLRASLEARSLAPVLVTVGAPSGSITVEVSAHHVQVPESLRVMAEEKIGRLGRFLDGLDHAEVHFWEHNDPRIADKEVCEVTIEGHGHHVRCKVQAPDGYQAIDKAYDKLEHQLHRLKTKLSRRQQARVPTYSKVGAESEDSSHAAQVIDLDDATDDAPRVVRSKRFAIHPMTPDEAAERMDLIGHGFFFFTNVETSRSAVVYRREDGNIGLINEAD